MAGAVTPRSIAPGSGALMRCRILLSGGGIPSFRRSHRLVRHRLHRDHLGNRSQKLQIVTFLMSRRSDTTKESRLDAIR